MLTPPPSPHITNPDGSIREHWFREFHTEWTEWYRDLNEVHRATVEAAAQRYVDRADPTGRLRSLIEEGPEGYARRHGQVRPPDL